jgi:hypothetical protein
MDAVKIVVYYLDIESLINLYVSSAAYRNFLESKEALFTLSKKIISSQLVTLIALLSSMTRNI